MVRATTTALAVAFAFLSGAAACRNDLPTETTPSQVRRDIPPPTDQAPYYLYQGRPIPLVVDPTLLVVHSVATDAPTVARGLLPALDVRVQESRATPGGDKHWMLTLPAGTSVDDALAARDRLRHDPRFSFVSTAYRLANGRSRITPVGRVAVQFRSGADAVAIDKLTRSLGLTIEAAPRGSGAVVWWFRFAPGADPLVVAARLYNDPLVAWADADMLGEWTFESVPNDPFYTNQYYLKNTNTLNGVPVDDNVELAWNLSDGGGVPSNGGLAVAIIDNGVDAAQPDLSTKVACGYDVFNEGVFGCGSSPAEGDSHGTEVAGIVAASQNNSQGITGIAHGAWLRPVRISRSGVFGTECEMGAAIDYAWQSGAAVLSNSWGNADPNYPGNDCITSAISRANTQGRNGLGSVVVFSAGNTSNRAGGVIGRVSYPARLSTVIAVGAINSTGLLTNYTPEGSELDLVAPSSQFVPTSEPGCGVGDVVTTDPAGPSGCSDYPGNQDYTNSFGGTSAAAPQVAGVAALLISKEPSLTSDQVKSRIYLGADAWGPATQFGAGKLDALFTLAPMGASITGPNILSSPGTYTWDSNPRGGSGTYTYVWRYRPINSQTWTQVGTGRTYSRNVSQSQINFWLQVTVTSMWRSTTSPVFVVQNDMPGCHPRC